MKKLEDLLSKGYTEYSEKSMAKYNELEDVLGECFDIGLLPKMEKAWRAFYEEPRKYAGTVVVEMVNQWIDKQPLNWKKGE